MARIVALVTMRDSEDDFFVDNVPKEALKDPKKFISEKVYNLADVEGVEFLEVDELLCWYNPDYKELDESIP